MVIERVSGRTSILRRSLLALLMIGVSAAGRSDPVDTGIKTFPAPETGDPTGSVPVILNIATAKNVWNALPIIADRKGFFREQGIDARLQYLAAGRYDLDALIAGTADAALIVDVNIAYLGFTGDTSVGIVRTIARSTESAVVGRRSAGIRTPADLVGKRVAYSPGTTSELFLYRLFRANNIASARVKTLATQPPAMFTAVTGRAVDAASTWEPFVHTITSALGADAVVFRDSSAYVGYMNLAVKKAWARRNSATLQKLIRALQQASDFARLQPVKAQALVSAAINVDTATVRAIWPLFDLSVRDASTELLRQVDDEGRWILTQRDFVAKHKPNYAVYFVPELVTR